MATFSALQILAYAAASVAYLGYLTSTREVAARVGRLLLALGVLLHFADIGWRCVRGQNPISSTPEAMSFVAFLIAAGYLGATFRYKLAAAGVFAVPSVLALVVLARVVPAEQGTPAMTTLGRAHIFLATVGVAVFALAAALAVLYLVEDRQLRRKQFRRVIRGGAPLETLDRLALRCVSIGFPVFTLALITGAIWIARLGGVAGAAPLRPEYLLAFVTWVAFGVLLVARVGAGWQGRRAAWLTVGGFGGAALVLFVYFLRHAA
ncbi:MAG TPA: cytochrome c biogenesis protein CcsA [Polyangia bacterium]|nr:cytochrome c biogenesis protein CcsA [Polyangia bacterium]